MEGTTNTKISERGREKGKREGDRKKRNSRKRETLRKRYNKLERQLSRERQMWKNESRRSKNR